ncbi:Uncharacterized conserved protein [Janthinobacterium sp. Marseille]|nr:Uncharacterized conserved protein [Janthinobacterium sp. Marseille]
MKRSLSYWIVLNVTFLITGCGVGGMWMNGNPSPISIEPHLQKWKKNGMTPDERRDDSFVCGGSRDDDKPFTRGNVEGQMLPGETVWQTRERLGREWVNCMKGKGYVLNQSR